MPKNQTTTAKGGKIYNMKLSKELPSKETILNGYEAIIKMLVYSYTERVAG